MASGKSTVGRELAVMLNIPFYDLDQEIEQSEGKTITTLFSELGESYFRAREMELLQMLAVRQQPSVIATGGGLPCNPGAIDLLLSSGTVFYLKCDSATLLARLQHESSSRPLAPKNETELRQHLSTRESYYERAHLTVDGTLPVERVIDSIRHLIQPSASGA